MRWRKFSKEEKTRFLISTFSLLFFIGLTIFLVVWYWDLIFGLFSKDEAVREKVINQLTSISKSYAWLALLGLNVLQVVVAVIPSGPMCVAAGLLYGTFWGTILSLAGLTIGALVVFLLVKLFGKNFVRLFVNIDSTKYEFLNNSAKALPIIFAILIFPGTPKDFVSFLIPFTSISMFSYLIINVIARTPATVMTVMFGEGLRNQNYVILGVLFGTFGLISILVLVFRKKITAFLEKRIASVQVNGLSAKAYKLLKKEYKKMENKFQKYAELIVKKGINPKPGQLIVISSAVENYEFVRLLVKECYKLNPFKVIVDYTDQFNEAEFYLHANDEAITEIPEYLLAREHYNIDKGACFIRLRSPNNSAFKDVDQARVQARAQVLGKALAFCREYTAKNYLQWCVCAASNPVWAKEVFPHLHPEEANAKLWQEIFDICLVKDDNDVVSDWEEHSSTLINRSAKLNDLQLDRLVFKNSLGTDLEVGLPKDYVFCGGDEVCRNGQVFAANIPTAEVFTTPDRLRVNGQVFATKPLPYSGGLIKDFNITFKDGKAVAFSAKEGEELLRNLINYDEGSAYLGEVALVPASSPISLKNHLFFSILYDENASCHLAFGDSYPTCIKGGENLSKEELLNAGGNVANVHVDFMFGSPCMNITGFTRDGEEIEIMKNGEFVI